MICLFCGKKSRTGTNPNGASCKLQSPASCAFRNTPTAAQGTKLSTTFFSPSETLLIHPSFQLVKQGIRLKVKHPDTIVIAQIIIKKPQLTSSPEISNNYMSPGADLRLFSVPFHYPTNVTRQPTHSQTIQKQQPLWDGAGSQHTKMGSLLTDNMQVSPLEGEGRGFQQTPESQRKQKGMRLD